ncbi:MAG: Coenzyme F420 hydrogenase/dehydrogenase, beta subunit C-terminal domain [Eubacteriales bacterium]|nr:Coenzyme F420 hydrogenase/dehydrogenase, beta subunit C-terminal domain [Eubacteriales bacterium]
MRNNISQIEDCCGCGACMSICPKQCISLKYDSEGFYKAYIDDSRCINCGLCFDRCPVNPSITGKSNDKAIDIVAYAAASKDSEIYSRSSSGGIFSVIAKNVLSKHGTVFGCGLNEDLRPVHMAIREENELDKLRRSKYVQSYMGDIYKDVKESLEKETDVLFVGTPCQIAGLRNYLGNDYEKLLTIDLVCHGVPSPKMYMDNIHYIEEKKKESLKSYDFRLKSLQSKRYFTYTYTYTCGKSEVKPYYKDAFYNAFYDMQSLNEICYKCPFSNMERQGDLTIGDYEWGKKYHQEFKDYDDISCILCNTEKGRRALDGVKDVLNLSQTNIEWIIERNKNLVRPTVRPSYRNKIYDDIKRLGYNKWADNYFHSLRYYKKTPLLQPAVKLKIKLNKLMGKV